MSIFEASDAGVAIVESNLDECVLCDLCIQEAAPEGSRPGREALRIA